MLFSAIVPLFRPDLRQHTLLHTVNFFLRCSRWLATHSWVSTCSSCYVLFHLGTRTVNLLHVVQHLHVNQLFIRQVLPMMILSGVLRYWCFCDEVCVRCFGFKRGDGLLAADWMNVHAVFRWLFGRLFKCAGLLAWTYSCQVRVGAQSFMTLRSLKHFDLPVDISPIYLFQRSRIINSRRMPHN